MSEEKNVRLFEYINPSDEKTPVGYVGIHPLRWSRLCRDYDIPWQLADEVVTGLFAELDDEKQREYMPTLETILNALGWQGGTVHQVVAEIKRLRAIAESK